MYDSMKNKNLFNMEETIAKDIFDDCDYPWEVLPKIEAFILELGKTLSEDEYDCIDGNIWIAKSATIAPTASITGPCIIGKNTEVRQSAFIRGKAIVGENCVVGNSTELKMSFCLIMSRFHTIIMSVIQFWDLNRIWVPAPSLLM